MTKEGFEKYSIARHRYIGTGIDLFVLQSGQVYTKVMYEANGIFHTETFKTELLVKPEEFKLICN